jgi:hypothetical protein
LLPCPDVAQSAGRQAGGRVQDAQSGTGEEAGDGGVCPAEPSGGAEGDGEDLGRVGDAGARPVDHLAPALEHLGRFERGERRVEESAAIINRRRARSAAKRSSSSDVASALLRVSDDLVGLLASAGDDLLRFTLGVGDCGVGRLLGEH